MTVTYGYQEVTSNQIPVPVPTITESREHYLHFLNPGIFSMTCYLIICLILQGCNKKFAQSTNLKSHILTHAKQKSGRGSSLGSPENITMTDSILQPQVT
jgi:hypothetical protein